MTDTLALCPFCGGAAIIVGNGPYRVRCMTCDTRSTAHYDMSPTNAIAAWNRRATLSQSADSGEAEPTLRVRTGSAKEAMASHALAGARAISDARISSVVSVVANAPAPQAVAPAQEQAEPVTLKGDTEPTVHIHRQVWDALADNYSLPCTIFAGSSSHPAWVTLYLHPAPGAVRAGVIEACAKLVDARADIAESMIAAEKDRRDPSILFHVADAVGPILRSLAAALRSLGATK